MKKVRDKFTLLLTLVILSPLILITIIFIAVGYPLHRIRKLLTKAVPSGNITRCRSGA
jgi:hypothetical protein